MAQIVNIFAKITFKTTFDLVKLSDLLENSIYNPRQFSGLVLRFTNPKASFLIFRTGKVIGTGIRSEKILNESVRGLYRTLRATLLFKNLIFPQVEITNFTASYSLDRKVNLEAFYIWYRKFCIFEPELFPALKLQLPVPEVTAIIFTSGKIILTGTKSEFCVRKGLQKAIFMLSDFTYI
jgi:transcription initiation factor TFIID TATA-box-binding protein